MKVGIIVYSESGHTLSVVKLLAKAFEQAGDTAFVVPLEVIDPTKNRHLMKLPDAGGFDLMVIAGPVQGFRPAQPLIDFISQTTFLKNQKVSILLTQHFKKAWLGGNYSIKMMKGLLAKDSVLIMNEAIVHWSSKTRETDIEVIIKRLVS